MWWHTTLAWNIAIVVTVAATVPAQQSLLSVPLNFLRDGLRVGQTPLRSITALVGFDLGNAGLTIARHDDAAASAAASRINGDVQQQPAIVSYMTSFPLLNEAATAASAVPASSLLRAGTDLLRSPVDMLLNAAAPELTGETLLRLPGELIRLPLASAADILGFGEQRVTLFGTGNAFEDTAPGPVADTEGREIEKTKIVENIANRTSPIRLLVEQLSEELRNELTVNSEPGDEDATEQSLAQFTEPVPSQTSSLPPPLSLPAAIAAQPIALVQQLLPIQAPTLFLSDLINYVRTRAGLVSAGVVPATLLGDAAPAEAGLLTAFLGSVVDTDLDLLSRMDLTRSRSVSALDHYLYLLLHPAAAASLLTGGLQRTGNDFVERSASFLPEGPARFEEDLADDLAVPMDIPYSGPGPLASVLQPLTNSMILPVTDFIGTVGMSFSPAVSRISEVALNSAADMSQVGRMVRDYTVALVRDTVDGTAEAVASQLGAGEVTGQLVDNLRTSVGDVAGYALNVRSLV